MAAVSGRAIMGRGGTVVRVPFESNLRKRAGMMRIQMCDRLNTNRRKEKALCDWGCCVMDVEEMRRCDMWMGGRECAAGTSLFWGALAVIWPIISQPPHPFPSHYTKRVRNHMLQVLNVFYIRTHTRKNLNEAAAYIRMRTCE